MIIYLVTNTVNGMQYVGVTSRSLVKRWGEHKTDAKAGRGWALHVAIRRYGPDAFDVTEIGRGDDWPALCKREQDLIAELGCLSPAGYNLTPGGEGNPGRVVTIETRAKLRMAHTGKTLSAEHRAKLSAAKMGKKMPPRSPEHCAKIAAGLRRAWQRRRA